jgi:hypothetical protein
MTDISPSGGLIGRLWRRCCDTARVWIPLGPVRTNDRAKNEAKLPRETSAKAAGRWPDAASLIAHRMQALDAGDSKAETGRKPNNDNHA